MDRNNKHDYMSYYEFIMHDYFRLVDGAKLLADYHLENRDWKVSDNLRAIRVSYNAKIQSLIDDYLSSKDLIDAVYTDGTLFEFDLCKSTIDPVVFIKFAHSQGLDLPQELLQYAGLQVKEKLTYDYVDKIATQAVARTLWLEHPDMTTEEIINHKSVQIYAGGKSKSHSTLRRWISSVDIRDSKSKPGPSKKSS